MKMGGKGSRDARLERVTICRDARSERPLSNQLDAVTFNGDGRKDRASLQRVTRLSRGDGRPLARY